MGLGAGLLFVGKYLFRQSRQLLVVSGEELLKSDPRPPVIYLRSFKDDSLMAETAGQTSAPTLARFATSLPFGTLFFAKEQFASFTEEEILSNVLTKFGPCVAVGDPNERLPNLGMSRFYFSDDEWRTKVKDLIRTARLVVMRAGGTNGFWEELEMAVEILDPQKLYILLPFDPANETVISPDVPSDYNRFRRRAEKILPKELTFFIGSRVPGGSLSGVIRFDSDWSPRVYSLDRFGNTVSSALRKTFGKNPDGTAKLSGPRYTNQASKPFEGQYAVIRPFEILKKVIIVALGLALVFSIFLHVFAWAEGVLCWGAVGLFVVTVILVVFGTRKKAGEHITSIDLNS